MDSQGNPGGVSHIYKSKTIFPLGFHIYVVGKCRDEARSDDMMAAMMYNQIYERRVDPFTRFLG